MSIEELLPQEKKHRLAQDAIATSKVCIEILTHFKNKGDWKGASEHLFLLCKKRGQLKLAISEMVNLYIAWMNEATDKTLKLSLIDDICTVTEGKMSVEVERARVLATLSKIREDEGKIEEACKLIQDVAVETFGTMERREKTEYIINQMRLVLLIKDFIRCQIVSKKINKKLLDAEDFQDLKIQYYQYLTQYYHHENDMAKMAECYKEIFSTPCIKNSTDPAMWKNAFGSYLLYLFLSPKSDEQEKALLSFFDDYKVHCVNTPWIDLFLLELKGNELVAFPPLADEKAAKELKDHVVFGDTIHDKGDQRWKLFHKKITEHNVCLIAKTFSNCSLGRLSELLKISEKEAETVICDLVCKKQLYALIDRPAKQVNFNKQLSPNELVDNWINNIHSVLKIVEDTEHMIQKELMLNAVVKRK